MNEIHFRIRRPLILLDFKRDEIEFHNPSINYQMVNKC